MSDLLNKASLVVIPSGYKEDTVYSVVPSDGSGDLSLTRASNGTRINSAGLVEDCPWNLAQYSEDFTTTWNQVALTIGANATTAPNGTSTADSFTSTTATANHVVYQLLSGVSGAYTYSVYVKKANSRYVYIKLVGDASQWVAAVFDLNDGTLTKSEATGWTGLTASSESVGNGWYKLIVSGSGATSVNFNVGIQYTNTGTPTFSAYADASFAGTGTIDYYIWGAQLNIGSTAKPYFPTTDRLNVPRLTYQNGGGGCPSLLLEKQSTNIATYSEDITQWSGSLSVTANDTISPDGTQNADKITSSSSAASIYRFFSGNANCTISIFAKKVDTDWILISFGQPFMYHAIFRFSDGVCTKAVSGITTTSTNYGDGWWRFTLSTTSQSAGYIEVYPNNNATNYNYSSGSCYIWGAQYEDLSSYPTSYIPTTSSSATRVADACFKTGISSLIGQSEGVWFLDFTYVYNGAAFQSFMLDDGTQSNMIYMYRSGTETLNFYVNAISIGRYTISNNTRYKIAFSYKSGQHAIYINGTSVLTSTNSNTTSSLNTLRCSYIDASEQLQCPIHQIAVFPTRLTNAELASLTTI